jgi:hypothetical protein
MLGKIRHSIYTLNVTGLFYALSMGKQSALNVRY